MEFTFTLDGDRVEEDCRALEGFLDLELRGAITSASRLIRDESRASHLYVDRTGNLTRSIRALPTTGRATLGTLSAGVTATMPYARYVEDGTDRSRAYQYLFLAWYVNREAVAQLCGDAIDNAVYRVGLR